MNQQPDAIKSASSGASALGHTNSQAIVRGTEAEQRRSAAAGRRNGGVSKLQCVSEPQASRVCGNDLPEEPKWGMRTKASMENAP